MNRRLLLVLLAFLWSAPSARAQVALNAAPDDPVYAFIDLLQSYGIGMDVIVGQRPYSRLEIARIFRAARSKLQDCDAPQSEKKPKAMCGQAARSRLETYLSFYERDYALELGGMTDGVRFEGLSQVDLDVIGNTSEPRKIPLNNGQGFIDGIVTSFDQYDRGVTYADGGNVLLSTHHSLYGTKYFAATIEPLFSVYMTQKGSETAQATVQSGYVKTGWKNFQFEAGRDSLLWGQGEYGGLMLSSNARPLDMIMMTNPEPWRAPWIFKYLGPMRLTFFVSNLGPQQFYKYPWFYGMKWSLKPSRYFELGFSETVTMGGEGAPHINWWDPIGELFPVHKWAGNNSGTRDVSNHAFGFFDMRITIPWLRSSSLYYDGYVEDAIVRMLYLPDNIMNQLAFVVGWYSPRLDKVGKWALRLQYDHTPPFAYRHGTWQTGYTLNQRVLGDAIGPTADAGYATLYWRYAPERQLRLDLAVEDYNSSMFYAEDNKDAYDRVLTLTPGPHERRARVVMGGDWRMNRSWTVRGGAGYEYIHNWNFQPGKTVNNMLVLAGVSFHFDQFTVQAGE